MAKRLPLRILVAEDHPTNQKLALLMLERLGYRGDVAANGQEVLEAVDRQDYDVILMDVQMPEMDGLEATRQIRQRKPEGQGPRIVAMTANVAKRDRRICLAAGMNDYLPKPIRVEDLVAALNRAQPAASGPHPEPGEGISPGEASAQPQPERPAPSRLDPAAVENLLKLIGGDGGGLSALITSYLEETPRLLSTVREALDASDGGLLRRAAHTLKSSSLDFGATELSELARTLEGMGKEGRLQGAAEIAAQAEAEYQGVRKALEKLRDGGPGA